MPQLPLAPQTQVDMTENGSCAPHKSRFLLHEQRNKFSVEILVILTFEQPVLIIYTYTKSGDDDMNIEKAPSNIRTIAASLWVIPAIILSYLFQNRFELFFFELIYASALVGSLIDDLSEFQHRKFLRLTTALPLAINSYYFIHHFQFKFPVLSFSEILILLLLSVPLAFAALVIGSILGLILSTPVVLISNLFLRLADIIYTFFKESSLFLKIIAIFIVGSFLFIAVTCLPENFTVSPFPPIFIESQEESEEVETVYISAYGECYHSNPRCSGMKYARSVTLEAAQKAGRRACSKCYRKKR